MGSETKGQIQAEAFINALYGNIKQGFLSLWTLEDKKTRWYSVNDKEKMIEDAMKLRDSHNVYYGVGVRKENLGEYKRGENEDILYIPGVWLDVDIKGGSHKKDDLPTEEEAKTLLNTFSLEPSIIVNSGGGWHIYWLFDEPARLLTTKEMQSAERMLSRFQNVFIQLARIKGFHIDNTSDLARILRVPGTYNLKSVKKPVRMAVCEPSKRYTIMELFESITNIESSFPTQPRERAPKKEYSEDIPDAKYPGRIAQECSFIKDYLNNQETANYGEWVAALSIASYCEKGADLVHDWSNQHPNYKEAETDRKYNEIRSKMKPRTCQSIHQEFGRCSGCPHFNKINSPIALGMERKKTMEKKKKNFRRTDLGNAERMVYRQGENIRFNNPFKAWYLWNGKQWLEDKTKQIFKIAKDTVRSIYQEASDAEDPDTRKALAEHAVRSESRSRIESMIKLAEPEVPVLPEEMDKDDWLFNCQNGVLDLKTGELLPHKRDLLMTKISPVRYEPDADCPTFKAFLRDIFQDEQGNVKQDTIDFIQKAVGYSMTGSTKEQAVFFFYGTGRNGKSTFVNAIKDVLGDYGQQTNADTFTVRKNERVNNDIADLKGSRLVAATESEEGARLAESLIKQLTGGEQIKARFLFQNNFIYTPTYKIFFMTNYKPVIKGSDEGIWRRIRLVPFKVTITPEKIDKDLPEKLQNEMPGILRWCLEGCLKWQQEGLGAPVEVQEATENYRNEMDTIGNFIADYCIEHEAAKTFGSELYRKYQEWTQETGEFEITKAKFNRKLEERGFKKGRDGRGIYFLGIGLQLPSTYYPSSEKVKSCV